MIVNTFFKVYRVILFALLAIAVIVATIHFATPYDEIAINDVHENDIQIVSSIDKEFEEAVQQARFNNALIYISNTEGV